MKNKKVKFFKWKKMDKYKLETVLQFGKHRGKTLDKVIEAAPEYVLWMIRNNQKFDIDEQAEGHLRESFERKTGHKITDD